VTIEIICVELLYQTYIKTKLILSKSLQSGKPCEILHLRISSLYVIQKFKRELQI